MNKFILLTLIFISLGLKPMQSSIKFEEKDLIGFWIEDENSNGNGHFFKENRFKKNNSGFQFKKNGQLVARFNNSFCGTLPITYDNTNGKWSIGENNVLKIEYDYFAGVIIQEWRIMKFSKKELRKYTLTEEIKQK